MENTINYPAQYELLTIITNTNFKPFDKWDWQTFAGCESADPLIGYYNDYTIVIDGGCINIVHAEDSYGGQLYELKQLA